MARPSKPATDQLTYRGGFRLTEAERQRLEFAADAAGQSVSDYVRGLVVRAKPRRQTTTPERQALIKWLGQLGNIRADLNKLVKDRQAHHFVKPEDAEASFKAITLLADLVLLELSGDGD
ncbi:plasmid mobilization protein [Spirosoma pomorum]